MTTTSNIGENPSICLNMIVKDESHIIEKTLEMLCSKICFSYWVICDTGSTDDTREIITNFFKQKNIPGELHDDVWRNFAHNRTLALNKAFNKTDLLFIFDADDDISGDLILPETVDCDGYYLTFGDGGIIYQRVLLINNRIQWCFKSVIHEFIACLRGNGDYVTRTLEGNYHVISGRSGSRSKDPNKYLKDANILEAAYYEAKKNNDDLHMRYAFYCANSYKDAGMSNQAIKWYKITLENNNWHQEKYVSCLYIYNEYCKMDEKETGMYYLVESFKYDCERLECVYLLIQHYCILGLNHLAYQYYGMVKSFYENNYLEKYRENFSGKLFIEQNTGNFFLPYYMIIVADKVTNIDSNAINTILKMYEIVFTTKCFVNSEFHIRNFLYNLHFLLTSAVKDRIHLFRCFNPLLMYWILIISVYTIMNL
jgi:tetratricopeptide (TPR) repeat protein